MSRECGPRKRDLELGGMVMKIGRLAGLAALAALASVALYQEDLKAG